MSRKLEFLVFIVVVIVLVGWGQYIIPIKLEISDNMNLYTIFTNEESISSINNNWNLV